MYTGTQKKAIVIKNTGNSMFEAAYFILKDDLSSIKESEMVREANKILKNNLIGGYFYDDRKHKKNKGKNGGFYFFLGALISGFLCIGAFLLLKQIGF
ncbi:MAG: hypothetical protein IKU45_03925 [Clostridia bacterium]|nr:hypothetical protein [Clostridia bacterium]